MVTSTGSTLKCLGLVFTLEVNSKLTAATSLASTSVRIAGVNIGEDRSREDRGVRRSRGDGRVHDNLLRDQTLSEPL